MYKNPNTGKWMFIPYDFDSELGYCLFSGSFYNNKLMAYVFDWPKFSFKDYAGPGAKHILDVLIYSNETTFNNYAKSFVRDVFNPVVLFDHIDEVKSLIKPYVLEDKTEDPVTDWNYESFVVNSEFTTVSEIFQTSYGLKRWILDKFRYVCSSLEMDCSFAAEYLEGGSFTYEVDPEYENDGSSLVDPTMLPPSFTMTELPALETDMPVANESELPPVETEITAAVDQSSCWSEYLGYSCCEISCKVYEEDENGAWGYENYHWCGIPASCKQQVQKCWSLALGYPCCQKTNNIYDVDENGSWGYEDERWCGIIPSN